MKRMITAVRDNWQEIASIFLLIAVFLGASQLAGPPFGKELQLLEACREVLQNGHFFYPTVNDVLHIPVSPLLTVFISLLFKIFSTSIATARTLVLILSTLMLLITMTFAARLFQSQVGVLAAAFLLGSWGFLSNAYVANGAVLYVLLTLIIFLLFFHWYDSAFRSRTYARSLYVHFILSGITLGLAFWANGIPGVLFPVAVMATVIAISQKDGLITDIQHKWVWIPFGAMVLLWSLGGILAVGFWPYLGSLLRFHVSIFYLLEPIFYLLPIGTLILPALFAKDIWARAILSHGKTLTLLGSIFVWSMVFQIFFADYHEAFSLLMGLPFLFWMAHYLAEVFRNPILPKPLQWTLDVTVFFGLLGSISAILLAFQIAPPHQQWWVAGFGMLLALFAFILLLLRDVAISRSLPFYLIPSSIALCLLAKFALEPIWFHDPGEYLSRSIPIQKLHQHQATILEWRDPSHEASIVRLRTPLKTPLLIINNQAQLESHIQTRTGPVYLVVPEKAFYNLPHTVREMGLTRQVSWQWIQPPSLGLLAGALQNDMLDFSSLTEPVFLLEIPDMET